MDIAVFGLGKLGLPWAAVLANSGNRVIGVDVSEWRVNAVNWHGCPGQEPLGDDEPGLAEMLHEIPLEKLVATTDPRLAVCLTEGCFIYVPTPSQEDGTFSNEYVEQACMDIGEALQDRTSGYTVVVSSTITPGSMGGPIRSRLEKSSGKECGRGFKLLYHPEFVALGQVISGMRSPWGLLVGAQNPHDVVFLEKVYGNVLGRPVNEQNMRVLTWTEAELTKLFVNVFLTLKPTYANVVAEYCERMDADAEAVTDFLGLDPRIGSQFLRCGPHPGGPCLPRDVRCAIAVGEELRTNHGLFELMLMYERIQTRHVVELIRRHKPNCVGVLGMAYKIGSPVTTDSFGQRIVQALDKECIPFMVHEVPEVRVGLPGADVWLQPSLEDIETHCDVLVVALPREEFREINFGAFRFVIDLWRFCDPAHVAEGCLYQLGRGVI